MSTPVPSTPNSAGRPNNPGGDDPSVKFNPEETFQQFWEKNARTVFIICALVLLGIIGKGGYDFYVRQQEKSLESEYAAANTSEKLRSFANAHPDTTLGATAQLQLADEAYKDAKYADAAVLYQHAAEKLKTTPLEGRAELGLAVSKVQSGQNADGEAKLKEVAQNARLLKAVRAEANYDLANLAVAAGKPEEAVKYLDEVTSLDPSGVWVQRAVALRSTLPPELTAPKPADAVAAPSASVKTPAKP